MAFFSLKITCQLRETKKYLIKESKIESKMLLGVSDLFTCFSNCLSESALRRSVGLGRWLEDEQWSQSRLQESQHKKKELCLLVWA